MMRQSSRNAGFSLLEVLAAFVISAVSLALIFTIYAKGVSAAVLGQEYTQALAIAESRLALLAISEDIESVARQGQEHDKYQWALAVDDFVHPVTADSEPIMSLKQVRIEVSWDSHGKTRTVKLQTLKPVFSL